MDVCSGEAGTSKGLKFKKGSIIFLEQEYLVTRYNASNDPNSWLKLSNISILYWLWPLFTIKSELFRGLRFQRASLAQTGICKW